MTSGPATHQKAEESLIRLKGWHVDRNRLDDWDKYRQSAGWGLNKTLIASECKFLPAAFRQNPAIKNEFAAIVESAKIAKSTEATQAKRHATQSSSDQREIKQLRERLAEVTAENLELRRKNSHLQHIDQVLQESGRLVKP